MKPRNKSKRKPAASPAPAAPGAAPAGAKKPLRGKGRPAKITTAVVEKVGELMALGVPEDYACALVGVNPQTFGPAVSRKDEFKLVMKRHHAKFMAESLTMIRDGGDRVTLADGQDKDGNPVTREERVPWTGRAWILERRYKPHFNKVDQMSMSRPDGDGITPADLEEIARITKSSLFGQPKSAGTGQ